MRVDAHRAWERLVPTYRARALRRRKLQGAGWDNEPHSVTKCSSAKFVLPEFSNLLPIFHLGNRNRQIDVLVYDLYALTSDEIKIAEDTFGKKQAVIK